MIITTCKALPTHDVRKFAWASLKRFQNIKLTSEQIVALQRPPAGNENNVRKQAEQIRFCLIQAREYFEAASAVGLATKPLLLYYGIMSLALAEILMKQPGYSSLDAARAQHAHHGLDLKIDANPSKIARLSESGAAMRATPLVKGGRIRMGTFELWHRSARETPLSGTHISHTDPAATNTSQDIAMIAEDQRLPLMPESGITLLDCFSSLPCMVESIGQYGIHSRLVRAKVERATHSTPEILNKLKVTIQPDFPYILAELYEKLQFHTQDLELIEVIELASGCFLTFTTGPKKRMIGVTLPNAVQSGFGDFHICLNNDILNEFGLFYVGLFILGNYARYYPDQWMKDVEAASPLSVVAMDFIEAAEDRVPLLALSELSRVWYGHASN